MSLSRKSLYSLSKDIIAILSEKICNSSSKNNLRMNERQKYQKVFQIIGFASIFP